jgi:Putative transposase/Transposase zinc-binding domain
VELRGSADSELRTIVEEGLPQLKYALSELERGLPRYVEQEFRAFLNCRGPVSGFAWLFCEACDHHRLVLFSCKTRGFCPSCAGRRMAERAAHWVDRVLPWVAVRQWVLTVPWGRRWLLARRPDLAAGVLQVALRTFKRWYCRKTGRSEGQTGSVTAVQRFGSALNLNLHFHVLHLDGVYDRGGGGDLRFFQVSPTTADIVEIVEEVGIRCERWLSRQSQSNEFGDANPDSGDDTEDTQGQLQLASLANEIALGPARGKKVRRVQVLHGREYALPARCASFDGYNLHANVAVSAQDRAGLERLCRYVLRPPLSQGRIERTLEADGRSVVRVGMKRVFRDGTSAIECSPMEFVEKLAALIPPPRANQVIYSGILAGNAALRAEVIPKVPTSTEAQQTARAALKLASSAGRRSRRAEQALGWAELLQRVFKVDGWQCPHCQKPMSLRTLVPGPTATHTRILTGLEKATGPPVTA